MNLKNLAVIVLAAGKGNRFGESYTKLLHSMFGKPLVSYPIQNLKNLGMNNIIAVVSNIEVEKEIKKYTECKFVYQDNLTGTAKAVELALPEISADAELVMVLNGDDATLYSKETLEEFLESHEAAFVQISMITIKTTRNIEAGRIIRDNNKNFSKILEHKEYLESGKNSNEISCGMYLFNIDFLKENLGKVGKSQNGEYYLTDLLNIAKKQGNRINLFVLKDHSQWIGINDKNDLKYAESVIKRRNLIVKEEKPKKSVHFLGIAGSGTSACAKLAQASGFKVTGCDNNLSGEFTNILKDIKTFEGHHPNHLGSVDILAISPAILSLDPNNPELLEAKERNISVITWQQFLGKYLTVDKFVIAISGTHGKSTTTAMVGKLLEDAGLNPTVLLGATTPFWGSNFRIGKGKYFVVEADEFNKNFMSLNPDMTILTNIEFDHPEYFKNLEDYKKTFQNFLHKTSHLIIANLEDENSKNVLNEKENSPEPLYAPVIDFSKNLIDFDLKITGNQNILNASAAFNLGLNLGLKPEVIKPSLQTFPGIGRRMEYLGDIDGAKIFSDFAHHPTAIKVAAAQIKKQFPDKNIWIIYQPHMFSRTKSLFGEFVDSFKSLDVSGISMIDIYPSREKDTGLIHSKDLVKAINQPNVEYTKDLAEMFSSMKPMLSEKDVVVFMGAGDIDQKIRKLL